LGGNEAAFEYARSLLKSGGGDSRKKAFATLEKLANGQNGKTGDFWVRLAKETLADEQSKRTITGEAKEGEK
ncbi:MAG: hypothetical protein ACXWP5_13570, partial [Bdellovibrionota bacterium]